MYTLSDVCIIYGGQNILFMVADRIKALRESHGLTQSDVAERIGISRSSVNAWEMGISTPSTTYIVALARLFKVSTDYLLGIDHEIVLDISGLDSESVQVLNRMVQFMRHRQK